MFKPLFNDVFIRVRILFLSAIREEQRSFGVHNFKNIHVHGVRY
jgi:hypothetical protein